jgi:hypothetical protein
MGRRANASGHYGRQAPFSLAGLRSPSSLLVLTSLVLTSIKRMAAPLLVGGLVPWRSSAVSGLIDLAPPGGLVAVQFYRVLGVNFLLLYTAGKLPGLFALPAGAGDVMPLGKGFLTSPSAVQAFVFDPRNELVSVSPRVLIPTFLVALSILLHVMSLIKLKRAAARLKTSGLPTRAPILDVESPPAGSVGR